MINRMFQQCCQELRVNSIPLECRGSGWKRGCCAKPRWDLLSFAEVDKDTRLLQVLSLLREVFAKRCCSCLARRYTVPCPRGLPWLVGRAQVTVLLGKSSSGRAGCLPGRLVGKVGRRTAEGGSEEGVPFSVCL